MACACGVDPVVFQVPADRREHAPGGGGEAAICPTCLDLRPADSPVPDDPAFSRIVEGFPEGDAGAAMALALGLLVDSLALHRDAVKALFDAVSDAGDDPWLVLERLDAAGSVQPDADLGRLRRQLEQLWG